MALDGCGQMCKVLLFLVNLLFVVAGMGMLCGGLYLRFSAEGPLNMDLKTQHFVLAVSVLMAVGAAILIAAAIGDYASCSENKSALGVYCGILAFLATLTVICGVLSYLNIEQFRNHVGEFYATVYTQYLIKKDGIRAILLRLFHNAFDCCALGGPLQTIMQETDTCPQKYSLMGISFSTSTSCVTAILADLQASTVLGTFLGIAGIMLVALGCSSLMYHSVKKSMYYSHPATYYY